MRLLTLAFCVALVPALAAAQVAPPGLEGERLAAYDAARLYIEGAAVAPSNRPGAPMGQTTFTWNAYRGDDAIGEAAFYTLVGREDLAARARSRRGAATTLVVVGTVAAVAGTALTLLSTDPFGDSTYEVPELNYPLFIGGLALAAGGGIGFRAGLHRFRTRATHGQAAHEMSERYNADLVEMLTAPPPPPTTDG